MPGRLNLFQAAMLRWRELAPYNAVHAAELPGPLDAPRLAAAVAAQVTAWGLSGFALDARRRRYEYAGGAAAPEVTVLAGGSDPLAVLAREMQRQVELPFPADGRFDPLRFFAVDAGATFHLGVAYDHFIAGGDSLVALIKGIACRYAGEAPPETPPPQRYPPAYRRLFARNAGWAWLSVHWIPAILVRMARAFRPRYAYGEDLRNAYTWFELSADDHAAMARTARAWQVTRNDLVIALLLQALAPLTPERLTARRRRELAIASVVNLRRHFPGTPATTFGQFLSSFFVSDPVAPDATLEALARAVHVQSHRVKRLRLYLQTLHFLAWGGLAWRFCTPGQRQRMDRKAHPVWGGVSLLAVDSLWRAAPGHACALRYQRAISTGPSTPVVLAPAGVGRGLVVGVSYRTAALRDEDIAKMIGTFVESVRSLR